MELKEFIQKVIADAVDAVDGYSINSEREVSLVSMGDRRTIEFDIAVSAEEKTEFKGSGGVRVLSFVEAGAGAGSETKNSTVSRITFGVNVSPLTKKEEKKRDADYARTFNGVDNWV